MTAVMDAAAQRALDALAAAAADDPAEALLAAAQVVASLYVGSGLSPQHDVTFLSMFRAELAQQIKIGRQAVPAAASRA